MNLAKPFITRPIGTTLLAMGLAIAGIIAFNFLPVSPLPQIDFPTINVHASLPGANPETVATSVTAPLERQLGKIAGINELTSSSNLGTSRITLQFDLSRDIDGAAREVQAAINTARAQLPSNLRTNPTYHKINPADAPIMVLSLTSDIYSTGTMYDAASTLLQQKLSQVQGVGQVLVSGSSLPAIRLELNPNLLNQYGIDLNQVRNAVVTANINRPKGYLMDHESMSIIHANDQLLNASDYAPLIIAYHKGSPVRLSDIGYAVKSIEDLRNAGLANGKPAVLLILFKEAGANILKTVEQVNAELPYLKELIPSGINFRVIHERTTTIKASLREVEFTLLLALVLVILVVYLFLNNVRAMLIPGVAVVLSLLGTFTCMYLLGFSLNNLSLMALTISTGFVVDDAIVVLENTSRHIESGMKPLQAAFRGSQEVSFTVLSMSLSLVAVFIPILLMEGIVGRLFHEFAVTLAIAILVSLIISLTLTPMMCAHLLKNNDTHHSIEKMNKKYKNFFANSFDCLLNFYEKSLKWVLHHPRFMLLATLSAVILNIYLYTVVPKGFFPIEDTGRIGASIQADQNISFTAMQQKLSEYMNILRKDSAIENVAGFVGGGNANNTGSIYISLKPLNVRKLTALEIIDRLRKTTANVQGAKLIMRPMQDLVIGGRLGNAQFQYTLTANQLHDVNYWALQAVEKIAKIPGVADVNSDQNNRSLQLFVTIDRDTAARLGVTQQAIDNALYNAFGQRQISTLYTAMNQYRVVMEVAPEYWQTPAALNTVYVKSTSGKLVPLSAFASFAPSSTLSVINHQSQLPAATVSFNLLPNYSLGDVVNAINQAISQLHLPTTVQAHFQGTAKAFKASLDNQPYLILTAIIAIYIVLGMLYESIIHPITILSTLPSAGVGALLALLITGNDLNIIALIGIILLIGIVKKNAIMMVDFALDIERKQNQPARDAIYQAAVLRFRPIMMTTLAAMLGALPLALDYGIGGELRRPLGIAIMGGLIVSQLLTLYSTPVIYLELEKLGQWCKNVKNHISFFKKSSNP